MLPIVAAMMMGSMSQRASRPSMPGTGAGGDLLGMLAPMLDADRDGSVVDDVMGMVGKLFSPL